MTMLLVTPPAAEPVTLAELKDYLRISSTSEDDLLTTLIATARETVEKLTGTALITQTWRLFLDDWPANGLVRIARYPVAHIGSVTAYDPDGNATVLDANDTFLDASSRPARLYLAAQATALRPLNGLEVDFVAGFGDSGADVPDGLRHAIRVLVAHWYEFRGAVAAQDQPVSFPPAFDRLIASWRRMAI
jgi:uncharacterized phiE125 gp8 family phage protein